MARMAGAGFRARVVGYDPDKRATELRALGIEAFDDLHAMLAGCDFVSLHATLTDASRHLIGAAEIAGALKQAEFNVTSDQIRLEGPLKELGLYTVKVHLHQELDADLKVWVVPSLCLATIVP